MSEQNVEFVKGIYGAFAQDDVPAVLGAFAEDSGTGKATGKALDVPVVHVWDIRDGKLARFRQFIDTVKLSPRHSG